MYQKKPKPEQPEHSPDFLAYCPLCEKKYNPFHARVIEVKGDSHLLHTQCSQCGSYVISLISPTPFGLSSIGVISDLSAADVIKFRDQPKITYDDAIEFHQALIKKSKEQ